MKEDKGRNMGGNLYIFAQFCVTAPNIGYLVMKGPRVVFEGVAAAVICKWDITPLWSPVSHLPGVLAGGTETHAH